MLCRHVTKADEIKIKNTISKHVSYSRGNAVMGIEKSFAVNLKKKKKDFKGFNW